MKEVIKVKSNTRHNVDDVLEFSEFEKLNLEPISNEFDGRASTEDIALTIVNTESHGKRITFSSKLIDIIGSPAKVQVLTCIPETTVTRLVAKRQSSRKAPFDA